MGGVEQPCYTLINFPTDAEPHNEMQLKLDLEKGDIKKKIEALKKTIGIILSGEKIPGLLMTIIRFVLPLQDHTIKKLLLIFWEIVPKTTPDGKLLQEMILVCDAYRKDLQHPNEFLRGSTLRFLCKLKEPELLEPLMPSIRTCLEHRHSYVRRNAVLAIFTIYRNFEFLIPDAPELISKFLETEQDMSCKRNAFLMLLHAEQERALAYLADRLDSVQGFGDILQLVIVELIYKVCHANPSERSRFIRTVYTLVNASSPAVRYEAAGTLVTLSTLRNLYYQHDGAPAHYEIRVREFLNEQFQSQWIGRGGPVPWPPHFPDLTPLDFYLWGEIKRIVYATEYTDRQELKSKIVSAFDCVCSDPFVLNRVKDNLRKRARLCFERHGAHFEQFLRLV